MRSVTIYEAEDGTRFDNEYAARNHERDAAIRKLVDEHTPGFNTCCKRHILEFIREHFHKLRGVV